MTKFIKQTKQTRQTGAPSTNITTPKPTAKSNANKGKKPKENRTATARKKEKKEAKDKAMVVDTMADGKPAEKPAPKPTSNDFMSYLDITTNHRNEEIVPTPLCVPLSQIFGQLTKSAKEETQGYVFNDRSFESEDDKSIDGHLKRGARLIENANPTPKEWLHLFTKVFTEAEFEGPIGIEMRDFALNLAASDPLELFAPEETDEGGNLFNGPLPVAWLAATLCHGSLHLYYDLEIQANRMHAITFDDMDEDQDDLAVQTSGHPSEAWLKLTKLEKEEANPFTYSQRFGEDPQDRCIQDLIVSCSTHLQTSEKNMTIKKWIGAFTDSTTKGCLLFSSGKGRQFRAFGVDLALTPARDLFYAHEWSNATHLRPQTHSLAWLAAVEVFGPLYGNQDELLAEFANAMESSDAEATTVSPASIVIVESDEDSDDSDDDSVKSADTAVAGKDWLQEQKAKGKYRKHTLRYDLRLMVPASQDADKTMIAAAKKFIGKAKEMDASLTLLPWSATSKHPNVKDARSIPEQMGAFKTYFHQAQPKVAGGHVYMRIWLAHDKDPEMLHEDLRWWLQNQQFGLYPRSVQAENIAGVGWLLYSTKEINCAALQASIETRLGNKYEIGCRFKMISLGRRGAVPKENQIKAIHIECDAADQFDVKVSLSKIYASEKNDDYPNGIRMRLVPEINSMISPETRQNVSRLRARQDNFQKQIAHCISWDIDALDFVDPRIGRSLRDLIMKIESRTVIGQPLFHVVDQTWNKNGFVFVFFPNVDTEARTMIMSLIPFLRHHYQESIVKWFSSTAQLRAQGAEWDPDKGCVKTFEDEAVAWMMKEDGFSSFDTPLVSTTVAAARPDPSNLQLAAGAGLIDDQDSVATFTSGAAATMPTARPAQLVTGSKANPLPRTLPANTGVANSVDSGSTRSSMTRSIVSRLSQMEGTMAKVDQLDLLMKLIAGKLGVPCEPTSTLVPPTPNLAPPATVNIIDSHAIPPTQLDRISQSTSASLASPSRPDGGRPLTNEGPPSSSTTLHEIRQSHTDPVSADVSQTDVGHAG